MTCSKQFDLYVDKTLTCFSSGNPPDAEKSTAYSFFLVPNSPPAPTYHFVISAGALPTGLVLDPATGEIHGTTPGAYADYTFTVALTGAACPCSKQYTIKIKCQPTIPDSIAGLVWTFGGGVSGSGGNLSISTNSLAVLTSTAKFIQRSGVQKSITGLMSAIHLWGSGGVGGSVNFILRLYNDETNTLLSNLCAASRSGGAGCTDLTPANSTSTYSTLNSCTRYRLEIEVDGDPNCQVSTASVLITGTF